MVVIARTGVCRADRAVAHVQLLRGLVCVCCGRPLFCMHAFFMQRVTGAA